MNFQRLLASFTLVAALLLPAAAQTPEGFETTDKQKQAQQLAERKKELERKTRELLNEVIGSAAGLKLPENRALVQASAADLLWPSDEKRARALFAEALRNLNEALLQAARSSSAPADRSNQSQALVQQRKELLQAVARRDADMALEMLRATRMQAPAGAGSTEQSTSEEQRMERMLAIEVAVKDPKRALQMAEKSLAAGVSFELLNLLARLNAKDAESATRLAAAIINRLHSEKLESNLEAAWLAVSLLRLSLPRHPDSSFAVLGQYETVGPPLKLDERDLRDLLEMIAAALLSGWQTSQLLVALPDLMPEFESRLPERAALLRRRIAEVSQKLDPQFSETLRYNSLLEKGTIEELLAAAAKAPERMRDMLYSQAGWKAMSAGDAERARRIVNDNVRDAADRERMLESIERALLWQAVQKERLDEARRSIARIKSKDERVLMLCGMARQAADKGDRRLALELLGEALPFVTLKPNNDQQLSTLLQLVRAYALLEPARSFEIIEPLVDRANELLAAAAVLEGFVGRRGAFRQGELVLPPGYSDISLRFQQYGKELGALALFNFERTKAAADKFQRSEARIMARLLIIQGVLAERLGSATVRPGGPIVVQQ
ncbi:MAG TPA: hypothetical protein VF723_00835 [Pyrinomonadaceae bacterium]